MLLCAFYVYAFLEVSCLFLLCVGEIIGQSFIIKKRNYELPDGVDDPDAILFGIALYLCNFNTFKDDGNCDFLITETWQE
jgi:hypothetical protein